MKNDQRKRWNRINGSLHAYFVGFFEEAGFLAVEEVFLAVEAGFFAVEEAGFLAEVEDAGFLAEEVDAAGFLAEDAGFLADEAGFFAEEAGFLGFFFPEDVVSSGSTDTSSRPPRREPRPPDELPELLLDEEEELLPPPSKPPSRPPSPPDEPEEELPDEEDEPLPPPRRPPRSEPRPPDELFWDELPELFDPPPSRPESMGPALPSTDVTVDRDNPVFFDTFFSVSFSLVPPASSGRASPSMLIMSFFDAPDFLLTSFNCLLPICFKISDMSIVLLLLFTDAKTASFSLLLSISHYVFH